MTTLDDVTKVAIALAPQVPFSRGQLALAAAKLRPVARDLEHLEGLTRIAATMAQAQGLSLGETALAIALGAEVTALDDQLKALVAAGYQAIAAAGALAAVDGMEQSQRCFIVAGVLAAEKAVELLTPESMIWATAVDLLTADLRLFAATLKAEPSAADTGSTVH